METLSEPKVSVLRDLIFAALVASLILGTWVFIYSFLGDATKLNTGFITFLGGVLAVCGLLFRQYMFKEVLDYLKSWEKMNVVLQEVIEMASQQGHSENEYIKKLICQRIQANKYSRYIQRELNFIPVAPIILIFLYGCALLAESSLLFRELCLFLMIHLVSYLAIAAITSTRLACAYPDLEKTTYELEELRRELATHQ